MRPDLGCLAVLQVEDLDGVVLQVPARPLGPDCGKRDNVLVVADDVVQLDAYRPVRDLERTAKPVQDLPDALVVAAERAPAREMPADVRGEEPGLQGFDVAAPECRVPFAHYVLVRVCHFPTPQRSAEPDQRARSGSARQE